MGRGETTGELSFIQRAPFDNDDAAQPLRPHHSVDSLETEPSQILRTASSNQGFLQRLLSRGRSATSDVAYTHVPSDDDDKSRARWVPEEEAGVFKYSFSWVGGLLERGLSKPLEQAGAYGHPLPPSASFCLRLHSVSASHSRSFVLYRPLGYSRH